MKSSSFRYFFRFGVKTVLLRKQDPILGTIIVTDKCNLSCKHCAVNNIRARIYPYENIRKEMEDLYASGVRILFFSGGETLLWQDSGKNVRDLVREAKEMGFLLVTVVTNGTYPIDLPEADLILLSMDGDKPTHDFIRGETYDTIMENIEKSSNDNILFYMALNKLNYRTMEYVTHKAKELKNVKGVSFNLHTPYPGTEDIALTQEERSECVATIKRMMKEKLPVFNLKSALKYVEKNSYPRPCYQCVVVEEGKKSVCGRCIHIPGLCEKCGYLFAAEYTLVFSFHIGVILEMLRKYPKYL